MTRCRICCCTDLQACPGSCSWAQPDLCDVCADVLQQPEVLAAARAAAFRVKDFGPSATKDLTRYAHAVAGAVLRVANLNMKTQRRRIGKTKEHQK